MGDTHAGRLVAAPDDAHVGDSELAVRARKGDDSAFDRLIERHQRPVFRLCWSMLGDRSDAEDAAQETFVRAYQSLPSYDAERSFGPWLRGIASNVCLQLLRRRSLRSGRQLSLDASPTDPPAPEDPEPSPLADRAVAALRRLDETYRLPLTLFYLEEASVADVAQALDISPGAVRVRLHRGREKLRRMLLGPAGDDHAGP